MRTPSHSARVRNFVTSVLPPYRSGILQRSLVKVQEVLTNFLHCLFAVPLQTHFVSKN